VSVFDCRAHASYTLDCQARADVDRIALSPDGRVAWSVGERDGLRTWNLDDRAERDDAVVTTRPGQVVGHVAHFESPRDAHQFQRLLAGAVPEQGIDRAFDQPVDDQRIEARGKDRETQVASEQITLDCTDRWTHNLKLR
jgi:hypothetical protein